MTFPAQVAHVLRKDLRRFWPAVIAMGVMVAIHRTVGLPQPLRYQALPALGRLSVFAPLFALLAAVVVQEDGVASERLLWRATPLSRSAVLVAKAVFIGAFCWAFPVVVHVTWIEELAGGGDTLGLLADAALFQGGLIAMVVLAASVTRTLTGFLSLATMGWLGSTLVESWLVTPFMAPFGGGIAFTRAYMLRVGWLLLGATLLAYQYRSARSVRTAALGIAGMILLTIGVYRGSPDWTRGPFAPDERFAFVGNEARALRLVSLQRERPTWRGDRQQEEILASISIDDPGESAFDVVGSRTTLPATSGAVRNTAAFPPHRGPGSLWFGLRSAPGYAPAFPAASGRVSRSITVFRGSAAHLDDATRSARLELDVDLDAFGPFVVGRLPLMAGATARIAGATVEVADVERYDEVVSVQLVLRRAARALDLADGFVAAGIAGVVLVNERRGEYLTAGKRSGGGLPLEEREFLVGGAHFAVESMMASFVREREGAALPDDWFDGADLLFLGLEYRGSMERRIVRDIERWPEEGSYVDVDGWPEASPR